MPNPSRARKRHAPAHCAARPRRGGLVVPWITSWIDGRPYLGVNSPMRVRQALVMGLCQICGQQLGRRIGLLVRPADIEIGWTGEPGMHPDCLQYSTAVCPMLNGSVHEYRARPPAALVGLLAPNGEHGGYPADAFDAWFITPNGYQVAYTAERGVCGLSLDVPVLMKRPVRSAAPPRLTRQDEAALRALLRLGFPDTDATH